MATFISLIAYTLCELLIDYWLVPSAEDKRRADFLDNAFGTHFIPSNSVDYYTNDFIQPGMYKAAVNLFENSLFTYRISERMAIKKTVWTLIIALIVLILGFYGFDDQPLGIPVLQLLFSSVAIIDLVKFWYMRQRMQKLYDGWYNLFHNYIGEKDTVKFTANVLRYWQLQETTLARTQVGLDGKLFNKLNSTLSEEWNVIKEKLKIKSVE